MDWTKFCENRDWYVICQHRTTSDQMICKVLQSFNRQSCPEIDKKMDSIWNKITTDNPRIFNAEKFRLHDLIIDNVDNNLLLHLGITDYKTAMCTNHHSCVNFLQEYGVKNYGNKHACFADPIAVNCVVVTSDNKIVLMKRAEWVAEAKGMIDLPGGHPEPEVISI